MKKSLIVTVVTACCLSGLGWASFAISQNAQANESERKMRSSQDDFEDFCDAMRGRWIGDVVWVTDWPGFGKKGDKVTAYSEFSLSENGHVLKGRFHGGPGSGTGLFNYDAGKRQIQGRWVSSGGNVWNMVIYKRKGDWHQAETGSTGDGKPISASTVRHVSKDGKTHRLSGTIKVDGKQVDPLRDVWRRIGDE